MPPVVHKINNRKRWRVQCNDPRAKDWSGHWMFVNCKKCLRDMPEDAMVMEGADVLVGFMEQMRAKREAGE